MFDSLFREIQEKKALKAPHRVANRQIEITHKLYKIFDEAPPITGNALIQIYTLYT